MNRLIGQQKRVVDLLLARKTKGITSQELRAFTGIVDVPKVISILRKKGYNIQSKREALGDSVVKRYWLIQKETPQIHYEYHGNLAVAIVDK